MKLNIAVSGKRRKLLKAWLEMAVPLTATDDTFNGMSPVETKHLKEVLDDIYTFCCQETGSHAEKKKL